VLGGDRAFRTWGEGNLPNVASWWLEASCKVMVSGQLQVKWEPAQRTVIVRDIQTRWEWHDEIDANSYSELRAKGSKLRATLILGTFDFAVEKVTRCNFDVVVTWEQHDKKEREFPCLPVGD
jgi:hypothetical protein